MAKFYVNRGGGRVPEGPFEEQQVVKLILAGKLRAGHVSEVGSQRFFPIESYPPFAAALTQAGVPAKPVLSSPRATPKGKSSGSNRGLLLGAVLAIFGLAIGAVAIGSYVMFSNGGMPIHAALPTDTEALLEVRSIPTLLTDLRAVRIADTTHFLSSSFFDDAAQALTDCFGTTKPQSRALILAATSLGVAGRKLGTATPEGGMLLSFDNAAPANAFFASRRFTYTGLLAKTGRRYTLTAGTQPPSANIDHARRALIALAVNEPTTGIFWFETTKLLFVGSPTFAESIAHVLALDVPSIEQAPSFKTAQQALSGNPNVFGYVDPAKLGTSDPTFQALLVDAKGLGPISASLEVLPAGLLSHVVAHLANADTDAGTRASSAQAAPITLMDRLPAETFAYVAGATAIQGSGADLEQRLLERLGAANAPLGERLKALLAQSEERLQLKPADLMGALGGEGVVALVARPGYSVAVGEPAQMAVDLGLVYAQALKDEAPAAALVKALRAELDAVPGPYSVEPDASGFAVTSKDGALRARARVANGYLFFALGGTPLVERSLRAFADGENTLGTDPAQRAARAKLPSKSQLVAWLDVGRVLEATQKSGIFAVPSWRLGFDFLRALHWAGPERVTTSVSVTRELDASSAVYRIDGLNLPIAIGAFGIATP